MRREDLFDSYQRELLYLRRAGAGFSKAFPKVAGRLALGPDAAGDPHVERLIESFAFLTGRLQLDLDRQFPILTEALLGVLHPHLLAPIPSASIARFRVDAACGPITDAYRLDRGTPLVALAARDLRCHFRTTMPLELWPLDVERTVLQTTEGTPFHDGPAAAVLRLDLAGCGGPLDGLPIRRLRLFIDAEPAVASAVYEALTSTVLQAAFVSADGTQCRFAGAGTVAPGGFDDDDGLLPYPANGHPAFRLLQDYFAFPQKFLFIDIAIPEMALSGERCSILLALSRPMPSRLHLRPGTLLAGCVPVVNLFPVICEPIRLDHRSSSYLVQPDALRQHSSEIYDITGVVGLDSDGRRTPYTRLFSVDHALAGEEPSAFWHATRQPGTCQEYGGTDLWLSLYNQAFEPTRPASETLLVTALCSNRGLAGELAAQTTLSVEDRAPAARGSLLLKPTPPRHRAIGGESTWKLVSQMALNHLSLSSGPQALAALQEILAQHALDDPASRAQLRALRQLEVRPSVQRLGQDAWRGFCRGLEITLDIDESGFVGASPLVFGEVLARFFAMYASLNSFTQLRFRSSQRGGLWKSWPCLAGRQFAL